MLVVGEKEFQAHRLVLSTRSPVFAAMFEHECTEKQDGTVQITDVPLDTFEVLLRYIYTDSVSSKDQFTADLLMAADKVRTLCTALML